MTLGLIVAIVVFAGVTTQYCIMYLRPSPWVQKESIIQGKINRKPIVSKTKHTWNVSFDKYI